MISHELNRALQSLGNKSITKGSKHYHYDVARMFMSKIWEAKSIVTDSNGDDQIKLLGKFEDETKGIEACQKHWKKVLKASNSFGHCEPRLVISNFSKNYLSQS